MLLTLKLLAAGLVGALVARLLMGGPVWDWPSVIGVVLGVSLARLFIMRRERRPTA